jgi:DNA-binding MarR family transcriptional regulator
MSRPTPDPLALAHRLHSAAIHLLRLVRQVDVATELGPAQLSALSVLVFGGPRSLGALAAAEQVRPPSMTRVVQELEAAGHVRRRPDTSDARAIRLEATASGRRLMLEGRERRARLLASFLEELRPAERQAVADALPAIEAAVARGWQAVSPRAASAPDRRASRARPGGAWRRAPPAE